jgi:para-nitrobenzyl esterase
MQTIVKTTAGEVEGRHEQGVVAFKGVPYAAPPFGARRFLPPARPEPWDGARPAATFGPTAPKPPYAPPLDRILAEPSIAGEDCLNLNVWTPDPGGAGLPVLVWVHGGGFTNGSSAVPHYAGDAFARDGVVCVTINYRLGVDGFLLLDGAPPNRGMLDQVAALEWVQENIAAFGGDPSRVTVAGESAGGMSVSTLLAMPRAEGLFRRAVAQSGGGQFVLSVDTARRVTAELARRLGVAPTPGGIASVPIGRLVDEQARLADDIIGDRTGWAEIALNLMAFEPVVDGDVVPDMPLEGVRAGRSAGVDLLVGSNQDEHRLFLVPSGVLDMLDDPTATALIHGLGPGVLECYQAAEPGVRLADLYADAMTDWFFRIPAVRLAEAHQRGPGSTHVYEFAWRSPLFDGRLRACHFLEVAFVFSALEAEAPADCYGPAAPRHLADTMRTAWAQFAASGDPGWPAYDLTRRPTMVFDEESRVVDDPRADRRAVWDGIR